MMTEDEFHREVAAVRKETRFDEKMAAVFVRSGWIQQRIADDPEVNMSRQHVSRLLCFGRFAQFCDTFAPTGAKVSETLTEGRFREYWDRTDQNLKEAERFLDVCDCLGIEPLEPKPEKPRQRLRHRGNIDVACIEMAKRLGAATKETQLGYLRTIITDGDEALIQMVEAKKVGLRAASNFVRLTPFDKRDGITPKDVSRIGNEVRNTWRAQQTGKTAGKAGEKAPREDHSLRVMSAAVSAAERRAIKPRVSDEEFERPPADLIDQQYPGREPGVTYATVHREQHGPIWHNVAKRRQHTLLREVKELAAELERKVANFGILDDEQLDSARTRWRITAKRIRPWIDLSEGDDLGQLEGGGAAGEVARCEIE